MAGGQMAAGPGRFIHVFNSMSFRGRGHSETCYRICAPWLGMGAKTAIYTTMVDRDDPAGVVQSALPCWLPDPIKYRMQQYIGHNRLRARSEAAGLRRVRPGDICYFWPNSSADALRAARDKGAIVVIEFINTHVGLAEQILDAERAHFGLPEHPEKARLIYEEEERLQLADLAFAPGPFVSSSIRSFSGAQTKLVETSYGAYLPEEGPATDRVPGPTRFIFVGSFGLRKGARMLLDAWEKAGLKAELQIVGSVEPLFADRVEAMAGQNVRFLGYRSDIAQAYREADVFVFPSLEEGGPQVTYEAAAHGMPLVVTPMGGGHVADENTAIVVEPGDSDALAAALTRLDADADLRREMGRSARQAAARFDWGAVSRQRLEALTEALSELP